MNKLYLLLTVFLLIYLGFIELNSEVFWADKVINYSSQRTKGSWSAKNILGKPNLFPQGGKGVAAWTSQTTETKDEFLELGFAKAIKIKQILIFESYNPGSISTVIIKDLNNKEHIIYNTIPIPYSKNKRILKIKLPENEIISNSVKIIIKNKKVWGYNYIDAVGIADDLSDYTPKINLPDSVGVNELKNLGRKVNSEDSDRNPVISGDGTTLFFARSKSKDNTNIYYTEFEDDNWGAAKNIGPILNNEISNYVISSRTDGNKLYLAGNYNSKINDEEGIISYSSKVNGEWQVPKQMRILEFENRSNFAEYFVSINEDYLLIATQGEDSFGNKDLYYSQRVDDTTWSKPINLGNNINTQGIESYPFLASDNRTLYFTSDGLPGYGEADLYKSIRLDNSWQRWSEPINLGVPYNSLGWDGGISIPYNAEKAYIVSTRNGFGSEDIFEVDMTTGTRPINSILLSGLVKDQNDGNIVFAEVILEDMESGKIVANSFTDLKGYYKLILNKGHKYSIRAIADGYYGINENLTIYVSELKKEFTKDLVLKPILRNTSFRLNNIFFTTGSSELLKESYYELNRLVELLKENQSMVIEVNGHTDNQGHPQRNEILSQSRANAVKEYLKNSGINEKRIKAKGFGSSIPISDNSTEGGRAINRRVEIKILDL